MLEKMGCDAESDSCGAPGDDIYLVNGCQCCLVGVIVSDGGGISQRLTYFPTQIRNIFVRVKLVPGDKMCHLGSL